MRISVIIPAWCEAAAIGEAVRRALAVGDEVIVADGGSPDGTASLAQRAGATVVVAPRGRGAQLHRGALEAKGDALLFLHADATLPPEARQAIQTALSEPGAVGGNFHLRFVPETPAARLFTWVNDARRRWLSIYYGDSAIFMRHSAYDQLGGFRQLPLFEDYELVQRLERLGRTVYVSDVSVTVSARRFERAPLRTLLRWGALQALYSAGVPAHVLARHYGDARPNRTTGA